MIFYETLSKLMEENKVKAKTLSDQLGIGKNQFKYWKDNGNIPNGETLILLADYFNVSVDYLLGRTDIPQVYSGNVIHTGDINGNHNANINAKDNSDTSELLELIESLPLVKRAEAIIYLNNLKTKK